MKRHEAECVAQLNTSDAVDEDGVEFTGVANKTQVLKRSNRVTEEQLAGPSAAPAAQDKASTAPVPQVEDENRYVSNWVLYDF